MCVGLPSLCIGTFAVLCYSVHSVYSCVAHYSSLSPLLPFSLYFARSTASCTTARSYPALPHPTHAYAARNCKTDTLRGSFFCVPHTLLSYVISLLPISHHTTTFNILSNHALNTGRHTRRAFIPGRSINVCRAAIGSALVGWYAYTLFCSQALLSPVSGGFARVS